MREIFSKLMDLLDARERRRFWLLMGLLMLMALTNTIGVASILPFLAVLGNPEMATTNPLVARLLAMTGAETRVDALVILGIGVIVLYVSALGFKALATFALLRFGAMRQHSLSQRLLRAYLGQSYVWFLGRHSADLARTLNGEVVQMVTSVLLPFLTLISSLAVVVFLLGLLVLVDPMVALFLTVIMGGSYAGIYALVRRRIGRLGEERLAATRVRMRVTQEGLIGIKEVKVLGLEQGLLRRFSEPSLRIAKATTGNAVLNEIPRTALEALAFGSMMVVMLVLTVLKEGELGEILPIAGVYALAGSRISPAMQLVYRNLATIRFGRPALEVVHEEWMAAQRSARALVPPQGAPIRLTDRLVLEGVGFAYPKAGRGALDGLDLEIRARTTVGIVGGTGAGKTTAIDLIMGLLEPQAGRITVDGEPIDSDARRRIWRRSIGYVPQHIFLVDDTVAANIAFGQAEAGIDRERVERAARMAQLHEFVMAEMAEGYDTRVGDRGVRLSGGQRQRIGIARALYHDPDVLVLDEATSALDTITERAVMEAIEAIGGTKTIVMVAHRLSTVERCDRIFLLAHGRVAEAGTYAELVERSDAFREMALGSSAA